MEAVEEPMKRCGPDTALSVAAAGGGCFECNICLEFAAEPVVTLCGHLYCWPCIYRWLQQADGGDSPQKQCPVCKASLALDALVPLYARGHAAKSSHQEIPRRPSVNHRDRSDDEDDDGPDLNQDRPYFGYHRYGDQISPSPSSSPVRTLSGLRMSHSTAGEVLGGLATAVLPRAFWNQEEGMGAYYTSPRGMAVGSPRMRRQEMRAERSLHQIWVFLSCCALLCLFLF